MIKVLTPARRTFALVVVVMLATAMAAMAQIRFARPPAGRQPAAPITPASPAGPAVGRPATLPAGTVQADTQHAADELAIRQVVDLFDKSYDAGDAKALTRLFTADAEMVEETGLAVRGHSAIEQSFAATFAAFPATKIKVQIDSIRFLSPTVAIEEGLSTVQHEAHEPGVPSRYSVVHVKQDGKWQMALATDLENNSGTGAAELDQLDWLVGNWVDESPEALVRTSFHWSETRQFLLGQFTVQVHGRRVMTGSERIGWDPVARQLRSWVFDSEGGFAEGLWTRQGNEWLVKMSGATRDGRINSATNVYQRLGSDRYSYKSRDRVVGGHLSDDIETVAAREPPPPVNK